jgi:hypothetical protein
MDAVGTIIKNGSDLRKVEYMISSWTRRNIRDQ